MREWQWLEHKSWSISSIKIFKYLPIIQVWILNFELTTTVQSGTKSIINWIIFSSSSPNTVVTWMTLKSINSICQTLVRANLFHTCIYYSFYSLSPNPNLWAWSYQTQDLVLIIYSLFPSCRRCIKLFFYNFLPMLGTDCYSKCYSNFKISWS